MTLIGNLLQSRFARFCSIGVISTLTHSIAYVIFIEQFRIDPVVASVPAFLLAVLVSYAGNYSWTFDSDGAHSVQVPRFVLVAICGLIANVLITFLIVDVFFLWYGIALAVVILIVPLMTYHLNRLWVFGE